VTISGQDLTRIIAALDYWIKAKDDQAKLSRISGRAQAGNRAAVTGGKHLAGINKLIVDELKLLGLTNLELKFNNQAVVPGYYRASKAWDLLAIHKGEPVLVVEYKSMKGSEGKNLNNRADEALGVGEDLRAAQEEKLIRQGLLRAYIFIMEVTPEVTKPVKAKVGAGRVDPVFDGASYLDRVAIMCERIRERGLYDLTWAAGVKKNPTELLEPAASVGWAVLKDALASHLVR
jgi:hypothetical protein